MNISIFSMANKLVTGADSLQQLTDEVTRLGMKNPLIVTDKVLVGAGVVQRVEDLLFISIRYFSRM
ncbi:iron-containing alcohol dehydrogenase [Peribacillus frigoritolerans]|nr:iron-containing alcohol dehydrogenase [Peribacillus frigoritolerans]